MLRSVRVFIVFGKEILTGSAISVSKLLDGSVFQQNVCAASVGKHSTSLIMNYSHEVDIKAKQPP